MIELKEYELWAILWDDAHYDGSELEESEIMHRPWQYVTVGILLKDDETGITVTNDLSEDGRSRGRNFVPAKMVVKKWKIGALAPRVKRSVKSSPLVLPDQTTSHL